MRITEVQKLFAINPDISYSIMLRAACMQLSYMEVSCDNERRRVVCLFGRCLFKGS